MKDWILYSLKCRKGQAGFALPVAIGMGLIILLVGLTMLLRSQDSQVSAIAQKDTAKSLNAAETGVNEIRALMNQHRAIANQPACKATPRNSDGTCPDSGSVVSWAVPSNIANILAECGVDRTGLVINLANREWQDVDPSDASQGEYQLLDYDGAGLATVQGRVNAGQPSESISRLEVNFLVNPVEDQAAGLWVSTTADTSQIDSGVEVLGPCSSTNSDITGTELSIPPVPNVPSGPPPSGLPPQVNQGVIPLAAPFTSLPRSGDYPNNSGIYQYQISTLDSSFTVEADKQVEIWVDGDIDLRGEDILHLCGASPGCGPFGVKIFGRGASGTLTMDGATTICDVFFHLPNYDIEFDSTSSSSPTRCSGTSQNTGVFWVNQWGDTDGPVLNLSRASWNDVPQNLFIYPPRLGPVQKWETQPVS